MGTLLEDLCTFIIISRWIYIRMRNVSKVVEKETLIFCSVILSWKSHNLWDTLEKYGRAWLATDGNIIWHMLFACWITKARIQAHTLRVCCTYGFSVARVITWMCFNVTFIHNLRVLFTLFLYVHNILFFCYVWQNRVE